MKEISLPYEGQEYYELRLVGVTRMLPLVKVADNTWIAYYNDLGDVSVIEKSAEALAEKLKGCDILITSESKGIALAHAISRLLGHANYVVCRKEIKKSMLNPIVVRYKPITSGAELLLCIDSRSARLLEGKRVGVVDDVVSTRASMDAIEELVKKAGGKVRARAVMLAEGQERAGVINLGVLPLFKKT